MKNLKFTSILFLLFALLLIFPAAGALADAPTADWVAQYYNNPDLAGNPVATVHESTIDHNWGSGSPLNVIPPDNFSARWTTTINFDNGLYTFNVNADDGVRVWIDGDLLIDAWQESVVTKTAEKNLSGPHIVQLAYFERKGAALVKFNWQKKVDTPINPGYAVTWLSQYYGNCTLEGSPITTLKEPGIDYDWGLGAPMNGVPTDNFSVRWTAEPDFEAASYTFNVTVDDGVRLWIDGVLVIDQWRVQSKNTYTYRAKMTAGKHLIQMAYFEATGQAVAKLHWAKGDLPAEPLPGGSSAIWSAEYFSNHTLTAPAAETRTENAINYDWGTSAPHEGMPADYFSVRWTTNVSFTEGDYTFFASADDGIRAWIDGKLIIDQWKEQSATTFSAKVRMSGGTHRIQVAHYEATGDAVAKFWWQTGFSGGVNPPPQHGCQPPHHQRPECGGNYPPPGGNERLVIDNLDPGFAWGGPAEYKNPTPGGYGTGFFWTKNSVDEPVNYAKWTPTFRTGGRYEVFVFIPGNCATTHNLRYRVMHNGERHDMQISQARYNNQWVSLGVYTFSGSNQGTEFVVAYDNTGEPYASTLVAFDAVKFEAR